jgi:hypothetical protein
MLLQRFCIASLATAVVIAFAPSARADFVLTDKNNANGVTIPTGNTGTGVYVMETKDNAFLPSVPGNVAGFAFDSQNGSGSLLSTATGGDNRQGFAQSLAGNAENGYVGTVLGKAWGNAVTVSLGNRYLVNGPGADLYITSKSLSPVTSNGVVQNTSSQNKSFDVMLHIVNQGALNGWHLYNVPVLPTNFQPAQGANVLGAIDLSSLPLAAGRFDNAVDYTGLPTIPIGTWIDKVSLINSNSANDFAFGYLGDTSEAPTGFVARRDFDNADGDGNAYTGVDYLTGRYGLRDTNGQDGPQAWFLGTLNVEVVPETNAFWLGAMVCSLVGLVYGTRVALCRAAADSAAEATA